jgi:hypothetical protein
MSTLLIAFFALVSVSAIAFIAFNIGYIIGAGRSETEVIDYCLRKPMNTTPELLHDLYPDRELMNPAIQRPYHQKKEALKSLVKL